MKDSPLLSICIPVYNGGDFFKFNLETIFEQLDDIKTNKIEVLVSDNCSTDNTVEVLKKYKKRYPYALEYLINKKNEGSDYNILKLLRCARGKYIHLMGADDWYCKGGIKKIIEILSANDDLSVMLLGNVFYRESIGEYCNRSTININFFKTEKKYKDKNVFFSDQEDRIWPLTNLVLNREYLLKCSNLDKFIGKDWMHIYFVLWNLHINSNSLILSDLRPVVVDRVDVQSWLNRNDGPRIYLNHLIVISSMKKLGFKPDVLEKYIRWFLLNRISNMKYTHPNGLIKKIKYGIAYFKLAYKIPCFYKFIVKFIF